MSPSPRSRLIAAGCMCATRGTTLDPAARYRLDRMLQGYVTQSLTTCMCCGSHQGRDRGERREITCDTCEKEFCDADA